MKRNYIKIGILILLIPISILLGTELLSLIIKNTFQTEFANNILIASRVIRYITIPIVVLVFPGSVVLIVYGLVKKIKTS
jgi:hypothetical protein